MRLPHILTLEISFLITSCNHDDPIEDTSWCDQLVTTWYVDADGDNQGDPSQPVKMCGFDLSWQDEGLSVTNNDCDDTDPEIYERVYCTDADCDGYKTDEGGTCTRQCSGITWSYVDDEGVTHCYSSRDEYDCDDTDPDVYPGQGC